EKHPVQIRRAAIDLLGRGRNVILMRAPVLAACRRIDREDIERGHEDQRAVHLQQPGIEAAIFPALVSAENLNLPSGCSVYLTLLRGAGRGERLVVAWPVSLNSARSSLRRCRSR